MQCTEWKSALLYRMITHAHTRTRVCMCMCGTQARLVGSLDLMFIRIMIPVADPENSFRGRGQ